MKRTVVLGVVLGFIFAACSGGTDDTTPTTATNTPPTTAGAPIATDFCGFAATGRGPHLAPIPGLNRLMDVLVDLAPDNLRAAMVGYVADFEAALDLAPSEVRDDVSIVVEFLVAFTDLLQGIDYNLRNVADIDRDDPRVLAVNETGDAFDDALDGLDDYCDVSLDQALEDAADAAGIPDGIPESLVPPEMSGSEYVGFAGMWTVTTDATFDEVVAAYTQTLGEPLYNEVLLERPDGQRSVKAVWNIETDGTLRAVAVLDQGIVLIQIIHIG